MKTVLPATQQPVVLAPRVPLPAGVAPGERGETSRAAQTLRPVAQAQAVAASVARPHAHEPLDTSAQRTKLKFRVDDESGRMIVSIVDPETSEVLRQIPAEELLAVARQIEQQLKDEGHAQGLFVADTA